MAEQYTPNLGNIPAENARRDCVHMAVAPVVAQHDLEPSDDVAVYEGVAYSVLKERGAVGIVDPFLRETVKEGQRFWLFLYPGTITGLRHMWSHPAFAPRVPVKSEE